MSDWKIIVPETAINIHTNPSVETNTTDWNAAASAIARVTTFQKWGLYSLETTTNNAAAFEGWFSDSGAAGFAATAATSYTFTVWMRGAGTLSLQLAWYNAGGGLISADNGAVITLSTTWTRYTLTATSPALTAFVRVGAQTDIQQGIVFYSDAANLVESDSASTHIDGDQEGCEWNGAAHASTSTRSAQSRAGGRVRDLKDFFGFGVDNFMATGMPPQNTEIDNYALLPGGELNDIKIQPREFTLMGTLSVSKKGDCALSLDDLRATLEKEFAHDRYPQDADSWQPIIIRYTGADVDKEIFAHYAGGLEGRIAVNNVIHEKLGIRFVAPDPNWYEIGQSAQVLDTNDTATLRYVAGRLRSTGQWDDTGLGANPTTNGDIFAIAIGPDRKIYCGGLFTGWGGVANRDYITRYDPATDAWETVGGAAAFGNSISALVFGADGTLYAGGAFLNVGGAAGDYVVQYDIATDTWSPVAAGGTGPVAALAIGLDGILYIGGQFVNWNAIANADNIVSWDGAAYAALGTGADSDVNALAVGIDGTIFAGGSFTDMGGVANTTRLASWDGSVWSALSTGANNPVTALAVSADDTLYIGGQFTSLGGITISRIGSWNGTSFSVLGSGVNSTVWSISIAPDGMVYVSGSFTEAGGITLTDRVAKWNGSSWAHLDVDLPGAPNITAVVTGDSDPVILANYDVWIGFDTTGGGALAGSTTVANDGTAHTFPQFVIDRSGGTSAIVETLRNETLGLELLFDYALLDGETLTLDNLPQVQTIESNFFGSRLDATLAGDDFGDWSLQPGDNQVTCFVAVAGGPTVVGYLLYRTAYKGHSN